MSRLFNRQYLFQSGPEGLLTMKIRDAQKVLILIDAAQRVIVNAPDRKAIIGLNDLYNALQDLERD